METYTDIFDFITRQETAFKLPVPINEKWNWNFKQHVLTTELYNNSQLLNNKDDFTPVKNITRPILNLQHRTENIEVKDVEIYVDDADDYHLSFLVKKYHDEVFVTKYNLDAYFDSLNISRIDFGGGLSKQIDSPCPEVVPLQSIVFCDQTDMLSGPIGIKHFYSPDQLMEKKKVGWGETANGATATLADVIKLSREEKNSNKDSRTTKTPGRYIEVYEVHGNMPKTFADPHDTSEEYETRIFLVCFYQKKGSTERNGIILYTALETESPFKLVKRDEVYGRALGFGGGEELFESQVWVNYDMIRMQGMLDAASKTILLSTDPGFTQRNKVKTMDNLEVADIEMGTDVKQLDTFPRNWQVFEKSIEMWESHAQQMGAANDSIMGESPASGTPFKLQELVTNEAHSLHEYRRGQYAKHLEEIYQDWIIPYIEKEIVKGATFLTELSLKELQYVVDNVIECETERAKKEFVLNNGGQAMDPAMLQQFQDNIRKDFQKKGNKQFIKILAKEFKDKPLAVKVNIAGKQKKLDKMVDKLVNIFRFVFSNPQGFAQTMQIPGMAEAFNEILEYSGLSPADFSGIGKLAMAQPQQQPQGQQQGQPQPQMMPQQQQQAYA